MRGHPNGFIRRRFRLFANVRCGGGPSSILSFPPRLNSCRRMSFTPPSTTGRYSGLHPAISAWTATECTVALRDRRARITDWRILRCRHLQVRV